MATVELVDVRKVYRDVEAVKRLNLRVAEGEFFSLLGPSGCGKSTTLRMIAGFVQPSEGRILVGGQDYTSLPPERRNIGIVFQNYAIFPNMNVFSNIAYGLKVRKVPAEEIRKRVNDVLGIVGLAGYGERFQRELSGGEQQRVALARVLVIEPRILLLDEPLSALDKKLREEMKYWIKDLQQKLGITTIYVTHDQNEALTMSDRIAVMSRGAVEQVGTPDEIYEHPASRFVTEFIGESNIVEGRVAASDGSRMAVECLGSTIHAVGMDGRAAAGEIVDVVIRPENLHFGIAPGTPGMNVVGGSVVSRSYQGSVLRYQVEVDGRRIAAEIQNNPGTAVPEVGQPVHLGWPESNTTILRAHA